MQPHAACKRLIKPPLCDQAVVLKGHDFSRAVKAQ
jgi:hypothetical protein